ncbi:Piwi-domain-containing protein [Daedalea quercina L-15889]|uniref:Piwi-domain-containing protein n=1 Tax=Daedalea quercina L-15889 TaxID=1314783 RepID=A0A165TRZ8_9APHY|nr:Piwi-domain-containing protein [Daedalea quercina L-15889]
MLHHYPANARAFFVEHGSRDMRGGLKAYRGFFQSVRPTIGQLILNVDTVTALLYQPGPLIDLAISYLGKRNARDLERLPQKDFYKLRSFLKGVRVTLRHTRTDRARPIGNLVRSGGAYTFEKDGSETTEHFRQTYNLHLQYPDIFGVRIGRDAVFPAELCVVERGQLYRKKIPAEIGPDFLKFSTQRPHDKLRTIEAAVSGPNQLFNYDVSDFMREAGLAIQPRPLLVEGKVLPTPTIGYSGSTLDLNDKSGAWNVVNRRFLRPAQIHTWVVVVFDTRAKDSDVLGFVDKLRNNLRKLGKPVFLVRGSVEKIAKDACREGPPTLVLAFLPSSAAEIRREIKRWGDVKVGVPTQCVREGKWERKSDQYCNNVALKINARLGGVNSKALSTDPDIPAIVPPRTMVIGADIGHPGPGVSNRPSMTSLVASLDEDCTKYAAFSSVQAPRVEIIENLRKMLEKAIYRYLQHHGNPDYYPRTIIFFRDGVSEGEYARVAKEEIEAINECLTSLVRFQKDGQPVANGTKAYAPGNKPAVTFIVVGKRHHIRFFPNSRETADQSGNCPPGFVVDSPEIISPSFPNYYLQSHSGLQGTSRPAHYIILHNDRKLPLATLQRLSFDLCHVYASATRSVSIPAPVYCEISYLLSYSATPSDPSIQMPTYRVCARAEFHFEPNLRFADSDSGDGTETSGSTFDLKQWQDGFTPAASSVLRKMYFL